MSEFFQTDKIIIHKMHLLSHSTLNLAWKKSTHRQFSMKHSSLINFFVYICLVIRKKILYKYQSSFEWILATCFKFTSFHFLIHLVRNASPKKQSMPSREPSSYIYFSRVNTMHIKS